MTSEFHLDLQGRLRNFKLPAYRALVPVFEAVVNSMHSIEEAGRADGQITIEVVRVLPTQRGAQQPLALASDLGALPPITGFRIRDNGSGFTDENYESFCTSDSRRKLAIGGRGVGRFTWLKAFARVSVESVYKPKEAEAYVRRTFLFSTSGVGEMQVSTCDGTPAVETVVSLDGLYDSFVPYVPKKTTTLAQRVVDHLFGVLRAAPRSVRVELVDGDDVTSVTSEVAQMIASALLDNLEICGRPFTVTHVRVSSPEVSSHKLVMMANGREVRSENLSSGIAQLKSKLEDGDKAFWWLALVESPALDESVTPERDGFTLPDDENILPGVLSLPAVRQAVLPTIAKRLEPLIAPIKEKTLEQVRRFVERDAPEYRHLIAIRPELVERLPPDLTSDRLDLELHKANHELEASIRAQGKKILGGETLDAAAYERFLNEENAIGKANLAKYVVHRRVVLDLFRRALERTEDGKYGLEENVHKLIFPLRKTSDEVPYEQLNLWMIDERLAYHYYLASDKELRSSAVLESDDRQRPDLIVFNSPFAFTDATPFSSIIIVEFKRPVRDDYTDDENPIAQVFDYITRVRDGKALDRAGRPIEVPVHLPFYCYVICDLTPKMRQAARLASLTEAPDRAGYFGYNQNYSAYVEVISFNKLVSDAEKRNRVFFEKLNVK